MLTQERYFTWLLAQHKLDKELWEAIYFYMDSGTQLDYVAWLLEEFKP